MFDWLVACVHISHSQVALGMLLLYHLVLRPLNIMPVETSLYPANGSAMEPRWPLNLYFKSWRDYEHR